MAAALPSAISTSAQDVHAAGITENGKAWLLDRSGRLSIWQYEAGAAAYCHQLHLLKAFKPDETVSVCFCQAQVMSPTGICLHVHPRPLTAPHCTVQSPAVLAASFSGHIQLWTDFTAAAAQPQQTSLGIRGSKITSAALVALPGRTSHGNKLAAIFGTQQGEVYGLVANAVTGEMGQSKLLQPAEARGGLVRGPAMSLLLAC